ncbi:glycosyltransferase family 2 protein [Mucilaginibacter sp. L3T2-6]|uniref:glycosyltransferase family 2 protein n=1 Tax=Mucilaginibacter sp. L3T2-6 TaxID=3062491 RepID=UPI002675566D|nr:glycosyltransferase family 2 protein [Mucilaginibacter sp. L3T2-6]MDO3643401.1 glycosyltransferase family 2 protein [Mucilaginibacter sp. L3T2-6]MDV6215666.1 glycosyltransferase family 2 protein [Mucilaginibacter sp. L3T2-6]
MVPVSVVIITKNVAAIIEECLQKAKTLTDDIIIICNGNDEDSANAHLQNSYKLFKKPWEGYGTNKNKGIKEAKYNWILSIDADEIPDDELIRAIHKIDFDDANTVYDIRFRSYFGCKPVRFGSWGRDHHIRLFNRAFTEWSETIVHETLILPSIITKKRIDGSIHHYSVKNVQEFDSKGRYYAQLGAKNYFLAGKSAGFIKLYISPVFGFFKNYILYLGFLDGREGWDIARITAKNTRRKYLLLSKMETQGRNQPATNDSLVVEY